nr:autoinducer binding domain-containing protein [Mesorhizobium sp.]
MLNYPNEWQTRYRDMDYGKIDPIIKEPNIDKAHFDGPMCTLMQTRPKMSDAFLTRLQLSD